MDTSVVNVKVDPEVKKQAQRVADELGLSLSAIIKAQLKQLIRTKTVNVSALEENPTEYFVQLLKEAEADVAAGRVLSFDSPQEELEYLDRMIADEKRSPKNPVRKKIREAT
jgi:addiction module RelB/DinJ family antitoxin